MGLLARLLGRAPAADMSNRWLIVGLGNPEQEYGGTRHNVGADALNVLAERLGAAFKPHKAQALVADTWDRPGGAPLSLVRPFGYMNSCGGPVQQALAFYKARPERLVVLHDELDLELATVRLKRGGGTAGHNGLKDIQRRIGTPDFFRVRIGIGRPPGRMTPADYVLKKFSAKELQEAAIACERAADMVLDLVSEGLEAAQNRHH